MVYLSAAAVVPIIVHLLSRRRRRLVRFPAVRFLRQSARRSMTRVSLKHLLLMLLRMAVLCLLALILARPILGGTGGRADPDRPVAGASAVIILDDSLSMSYRRGDVSWFERARNHALEVIDQLPPEAEAAVMTLSRPSLQFTRDRNELRSRVTGLQPTMGAGSCPAALEQAAHALRERAAGAGGIFLLTDMTPSAWPGLSQRPEAEAGIPMVDLGEATTLDIVSVGDLEASNLAVTRLSHDGESLLQGAVLHLVAEFLCIGPQTEEVVQCEFDGLPVDRRTVRLPANGSETVSFRVLIDEPGHHWGQVSFQNSDALPPDGARMFSLEVAGAISVLCVAEQAPAGEPGGAYFFETALVPWAGPDRGLFKLKTVSPEELEAEQLSGFDVIALLDCPGPSPIVWERLEDFVAGGGALLVSAGPGLEPGDYSSDAARRVLPAAPGDVVSAPPGADGPLRMRVLKTGHPLVVSLTEAGADPGRAAMRHCRRLELTGEGEELFSFGDGLPALVVRESGGRVGVFAGGFGTQWSDFPREQEFLPFCQELVLYLARAGAARLSSFQVGQRATIRFQASSPPTSITVVPPGAEEGQPLSPVATDGRQMFGRTHVPGYYRVEFQRRGTRWSSGFCVNTAPLESDLRMVAGSEVRAAVRAGRLSVHKDASALSIARLGRGSVDWAGLELTPYLVLLALAVCLAEGLLANRIYRAPGGPEEPPTRR